MDRSEIISGLIKSLKDTIRTQYVDLDALHLLDVAHGIAANATKLLLAELTEASSLIQNTAKIILSKEQCAETNHEQVVGTKFCGCTHAMFS